MSGVEARFIDSDLNVVLTSLTDLVAADVVRGVPVRRISSRPGQRNYPGWFWSTTTGDHVRYESRLELDRMWLADFDPQVVFFAAQPFFVSGESGGVFHSHTPDLLLERADGGFVVVDVKPAEIAALPEIAEVFAWTARLCASRGWEYEVWSSGSAQVLANIRFLGGYRRDWLLPAGLAESVSEEFRPGMTMGELAARVGAGGRAGVLAALWAGVLMTDLTAPLSSASVLMERNGA